MAGARLDHGQQRRCALHLPAGRVGDDNGPDFHDGHLLRRTLPEESRRAGHQIDGSHALEITWSVIPFCVFMVFFFWGALLYFKERKPPQNSAEVYTVAKQWMWKFEHMEGQREINELHVPLGRDVKMTMTSQDVIHSFYVP